MSVRGRQNLRHAAAGFAAIFRSDGLAAVDLMVAGSKRKTSLMLDAATLDAARGLGINISAVADAALRRAVADALRRKWLDENAETFVAQAAWHERNDHPLSDISVSLDGATWSG